MRIDPSALACLERYAFPGNVRELRNILERAVLLSDGDVILPEHLPEACRGNGAPANPQARFKELIPLEELEVLYLRWAAAHYRGSKAELAKRLGMSERTLYRRLAQSSSRRA